MLMTAYLADRSTHSPTTARSSRAAWRDKLAELAAAQDDLVTSAQLRDIGVPSSTSSGRSRRGGYWTRVLPGVYLVSGGRPDRRQRERAALLYSAPHGMLSGPTALRHLGVRSGRLQEVSDDHRAPEPVHLLMPHSHHLLAAGFLEITRTRRWPDEQRVNGLTLPSTARAIADTARRARTVREVTALVDECLRRGLTALEELMSELRDGPRQGSAHLRAALHARRQSAEHGVHGLVSAVIDGAGLSEPLWEARLIGPEGEPVGAPLVWVDSIGLAIDLAGPDSAAVARQQRYAAHGISIFPVSTQLLLADPSGQVRMLAQAAHQASQRPRPRVLVVPP